MLTIQLLQLVQPGSDIVKRRRDHLHGANEDSNISVKQVNENIKNHNQVYSVETIHILRCSSIQTLYLISTGGTCT